jgi:DNA-binding MarR family transcriptional regulator
LTHPTGLRITELLDDVLLTQPGMSRLIARLEERGLVERADDADDRRACRIRLTSAGARAQREVGLAHGRHVAEAMTRGLSREQLVELRDMCRALVLFNPQARLLTSHRSATCVSWSSAPA